MNCNDLCDYIITRCTEANVGLNTLKLQKLVYYTQAWFLAFYDEPLIKNSFMAWVHGPVCREIYDRFKDSKSLYSEITLADILPTFTYESVAPYVSHINSILEVYSGFSGSQLEEMSHNETPWIVARKGYSQFQRCEVEIDNEIMKSYFKSRIN